MLGLVLDILRRDYNPSFLGGNYPYVCNSNYLQNISARDLLHLKIFTISSRAKLGISGKQPKIKYTREAFFYCLNIDSNKIFVERFKSMVLFIESWLTLHVHAPPCHHDVLFIRNRRFISAPKYTHQFIWCTFGRGAVFWKTFEELKTRQHLPISDFSQKTV